MMLARANNKYTSLYPIFCLSYSSVNIFEHIRQTVSAGAGPVRVAPPRDKYNFKSQQNRSRFELMILTLPNHLTTTFSDWYTKILFIVENFPFYLILLWFEFLYIINPWLLI